MRGSGTVVLTVARLRAYRRVLNGDDAILRSSRTGDKTLRAARSALSYDRRMPARWHCPIPDCTWSLVETVALVEHAATEYARTHHGELPDPGSLLKARAGYVEDTVGAHLAGHDRRAVRALAARQP